MIEINLLPKDYRKNTRGFAFGKVGFYALGGVVGIAVILCAVTLYQIHQLDKLSTDIEKANQRASLLREDIRVVDALTDVKEKIRQRMEAVEQLDQNRSAWVRILQDMARNVPEFVWLGKFEELPLPAPKKDDTTAAQLQEIYRPASTKPVEVRGYAFTLNSLAAFMIKMMRSDYFDDVELVSSQDTLIADERAYNFQLSANVHYISDDDLRDKVALADKTESGKTSHTSLN